MRLRGVVRVNCITDGGSTPLSRAPTANRAGVGFVIGVEVCQLSGRESIILPITGVGVCLMPLLHFPFCAIELRQVADLGADPYGLAGDEV